MLVVWKIPEVRSIPLWTERISQTNLWTLFGSAGTSAEGWLAGPQLQWLCGGLGQRGEALVPWGSRFSSSFSPPLMLCSAYSPSGPSLRYKGHHSDVSLGSPEASGSVSSTAGEFGYVWLFRIGPGRTKPQGSSWPVCLWERSPTGEQLSQHMKNTLSANKDTSKPHSLYSIIKVCWVLHLYLFPENTL